LGLFSTATRFALTEHLRNRFAMALVAAFIPLWTTLAYLAAPDAPVRMRLRATGEVLLPRGNQLTEITGALNAVTLITGFMMFAATFAGHDFDRRLAMAGYPRIHLVLAKVAALALASAAVSAYATALFCVTWTPRQPVLLAVALFSAAMTYGVLGVGFGAMMGREVEGMFAILMTSVIDLGLQNPVTSAGSDSPVTRFLPSYGAVQTGTAAGFSTTGVPGYVAIQFGWLAVTGIIALIAFLRRTRNTLPSTAVSCTPGPGARSGGRAHEAINVGTTGSG
jgi:hypothetical protein